MNRSVAIISLLLALALGLPGGGLLQPSAAAGADEPWRVELESVCGQADAGVDLPVAELKSLLKRCDDLLPQLEALEPTPRKVYLKKLQMCRKLLAFLLESKENKKLP